MKGSDKVASFTVLVMEEVDGSVSDPNAELSDQDIEKEAKGEFIRKVLGAKPVSPTSPRLRGVSDRLAGKQVSKSDIQKPTAPAARSIEAKLAPLRRGFEGSPTGKKEFTRKKLTAPPKAKAIKRASKVKPKAKTAPTKKKGFTVRKLVSRLAPLRRGFEGSPTGKKTSRLAAKKKPAPKGKGGFKKRKLR